MIIIIKSWHTFLEGLNDHHVLLASICQVLGIVADAQGFHLPVHLGARANAGQRIQVPHCCKPILATRRQIPAQMRSPLI